MHDDLLPYYERELAYLRQLGGEFAIKYPKIASRLSLSADRCEDPHVERLLEAVAFLTARIQHKIDDEFPEITEGLLSILFPHYLAPIPSLAIIQFVLDPNQGKLEKGFRIDRHARLYSQPVYGMPCRFRTCYPVTLWPIEVKSARFDEPTQPNPNPKAVAVLRLELVCQADVVLQNLQMSSLRFFLNGESQAVHDVYELLFNDTCHVQLRPLAGEGGHKPIVLPMECVTPVGFDEEEGLLPYSHRSFVGYRLLQEYFAFPEKFLFFDLSGLDRATKAGFRKGMEVLFFLNRSPRKEQSINAGTFRLGCTPIVNLFEKIAEPIRLDHFQAEYRVISDLRKANAAEVYSINSVTLTTSDSEETIPVRPFYSITHAQDHQKRAFWMATRRPSQKKDDPGSEVYLSLVDLEFQPTRPAGDTLTVHVTCTNRDLPGKLPFGGERKDAGDSRDFDLEAAAPLSRISALTKPTETIRPPLRHDAQWRLLSHLSLNYLSICEGGKEAFQEILRLYDFTNKAAIRQQIEGIINVSSRRVVRRPLTMPWNGFCRGLEVTIEFNEANYVGGGVFLLASVLERFLGLYASLNSFTQLVATTKQREGPLRRWTPRAGDQILL